MSKKMSKILCLVLTAAFVCLSLSGCAPAASADAGAGGAAAGFSSILMLVVMIAVFYFILIRPENKRKKKLEQMRSALSVGDKITTIGGIVGKIVDISGDLITFETGEDRVRIQVTKWAISTTGIEKNEDGSK